VLLLDEPLSNLDAHLRDEMRELIFSIQRQLDITTIFVTHDQEEAVVLADTIALMFDGKLQQFDHPNAFYERPSSVRTARFFGGINFLEGVKQGECVETTLGTFQVNAQEISDGPVVITVRPGSPMAPW
jgi:ABC-type Fe3+/spermidine/putrescine transport system ATPase subunit